MSIRNALILGIFVFSPYSQVKPQDNKMQGVVTFVRLESDSLLAENNSQKQENRALNRGNTRIHARFVRLLGSDQIGKDSLHSASCNVGSW